MTGCPSCGHDNPEGGKFCSECGARLGASPAAGREVRKVVTVLFCDVTGSTALGERLDPESLRRVMTRYFERMQQVLESHGGAGEVVAGEPAARQNLVTGDTVNTAARLEQAAGPGEILLGEATYELARDAVSVEPVDPLAPKGKA